MIINFCNKIYNMKIGVLTIFFGVQNFVDVLNELRALAGSFD